MARKLPSNGNLLGVDYGQAKTGLALAGAVAKLPSPFMTVSSEKAEDKIAELIESQDVKLVVVGLPKSLEGNETSQSKQIRRFAEKLKQSIDIPLVFADETLSSVRAERYLKDHRLSAEDVDSVAACFILEELFKEYGG